jgi:hypothetical protein
MTHLLLLVVLASTSPSPAPLIEVGPDNDAKGYISKVNACFKTFADAVGTLEESERSVCDIPNPTGQQSEACGRLRETHRKVRESLSKSYDVCMKNAWDQAVSDLYGTK